MAAPSHVDDSVLTANKFMELCNSKEYKAIIQQAIAPLKKEIKTLKLRVQKQENDINELRIQMAEYNQEIAKANTEKNRHEAGDKINNLKFTGIGDTDDPKGKIIEIIKEELKIEINEDEIEIIPDRRQQISTKNETESRRTKPPTSPQATETTTKMHVVKFKNIWKKRLTYRNRIQLRSRIYINEDLTKEKSQLFYQCRNMKKQKAIKTTWTQDGTVYIRTNEDEKLMINNQKELTDALAKHKGTIPKISPNSSGSFIHFTHEETKKAEQKHKRSTKKLQQALSRSYSENYESCESCSNTSID